MLSQEQKDVRVATVGISVEIKGDISAAEDLSIEGQVEGRIDLPEHTLTIGPNATVVGDVAAHRVVVFGSVTGTIVARDRADVRKSASIEGAITCERLSVQEGAIIVGKIDTKNRKRSATERSEQAA